MTKFVAAYAAIVVAMVALDLLWLGIIAKPLYQQGIGHLMAERPNIAVAVLFYALYALGLMLFVVVPNAEPASWRATLVAAALFGLFAYATYDLTNLATLKAWPWGLSLLDMAWGCALSVAVSSVGRLVLARLG
ncbi:MAG: DUF2177 family protein [Burkholderiales bacterium]|nr:DUF2177 family protein [Burkholderiales bacterium]